MQFSQEPGLVRTARLIDISIAEGETGVFFATSADEPTFYVSATSLDNLVAALPWAIEHMIRSRDHFEVAAIPTDKGNITRKAWALVPKELIALREEQPEELRDAS
jgi:hypothetical protein